MSFKLSTKQIDQVLKTAVGLQKPRRKAPPNPFGKRIGPIIKSPEGKIFLIRLMDVAFRTKNYSRVSSYVYRLFKSTDAHQKLFSTQEKVLVRLFNMIGYKLPSVSVPLMLKEIQDVTSPVVYFLGDKKYKEHYGKRKKQKIQLNINLIGEALIGEKEAEKRIEQYCNLLGQKEVDYISIKASTIYSQIESIAHDQVVDVLVEKLSIIYRKVLQVEKETGVQKFVNLDMEEYRDLSITLATFKKALEKEEFKSLRAGIVIQAYLPDAFNEVCKLQEWAVKRVESGGAPVKVRIVKGANIEMELTEASMRDWPVATYGTKLETDANYKRVLLQLLDADKVKSMNVGVASHNIFDLAFALKLVEDLDISDFVDFEMLEGVAQGTVMEIVHRGMNVVLYTPIVKPSDYNNAIAYLVRRLDEGTQKGNFLREGFNLDVNSEKWEELQQNFLYSLGKMDVVKTTPNRTQDRSTQVVVPQTEFKNVPDTDWALEANRKWIASVKKRWEKPVEVVGDLIPVVMDGASKERSIVKQENWKGKLPWQYELATEGDYKEFIAADSEWYGLSTAQKVKLLRNAAVKMEERRGDLIAVAIEELGKTAPEVDVEVSEAIDFANFYAQALLDVDAEGVSYECSGVNLVLSPWNFPIAIPIGGVLASLAAGKKVILKPSQNAAACAYLISQCLWDAGIPKSAFAFLPTEESNLDAFLSEGNTFDAVILTGGTATAQFLLKRNPHLNLYAETGGKNATIVTALSDRDQAIKNVVQSAFGNTGQKCSATSLLILEEEVFNDKHFKELLKDAAESRVYGDPWDFHTSIGPLAVPINDRIKHVIENTADKDWLLKPELEGDYLLKPGIKWGITTADYGYKNELFGPILFVMKANGLQDAIDKVNGVEYGLTSGIESLAREEVRYWKNNVIAGNLYANRSTTGAIVMRQPFGGMKASCYGFGMKAGGVNYVRQFLNLKPVEMVDMSQIENNYLLYFLSHFNKEVDYAHIRGQHNTCRYIKPNKVLVLVGKDTTQDHLDMVLTACDVLKIEAQVYAISELSLKTEVPLFQVGSWDELVPDINFETRVRSLTNEIDDAFRVSLHEKHINIYDRTPVPSGRFELLNYLSEQSISINYHRYGNQMGERSK
ncbi:bifunctional proline dehydrogenase/L-glutamate gamma-semialdehyde dehydrogenase [Flammeovirgaceae bacterium SG7u.111]|nr:bifunctional proline dehydrogenase/L-glutamate gamma-semialdehyde dehydrogenase [Flammeovirgaceae bacterium SG7u.132]WPO37995.1 bifunctional proline dehydrogenase/L-glutamate gamma-semialdehyde dehydrogenase [Flammeovirgaceae bacterium SG7u.111]